MYLLRLSDFNETWIFSTDFRKKSSIFKFRENRLVGDEFSRQTDIHGQDNSHFRNSANAAADCSWCVEKSLWRRNGEPAWFLNNLFYKRRNLVTCPSRKREFYTLGPIFPLLSILCSQKWRKKTLCLKWTRRQIQTEEWAPPFFSFC